MSVGTSARLKCMQRHLRTYITAKGTVFTHEEALCLRVFSCYTICVPFYAMIIMHYVVLQGKSNIFYESMRSTFLERSLLAPSVFSGKSSPFISSVPLHKPLLIGSIKTRIPRSARIDVHRNAHQNLDGVGPCPIPSLADSEVKHPSAARASPPSPYPGG